MLNEMCDVSSETSLLSSKIFHFRNIPGNEEILEVTYKYSTLRDEKGDFLRSENGNILAYNEIFSKLSGMDYENAKNNPQKILQISENEIFSRQEKLQDLKEKVQKSTLPENRKNMIISTLESYKNRLEIAKTGLIFELEKSWIQVEISENERKEKIQKIQNLQTKEFGEDVSESWIASEQVFYKIRQNFSKNKQKFSLEERKRFEELYEKMKNFIETKHQKKLPDLDDFVEEKPLRDDLEKFKNIMISREEYVKIFQLVIDMMGLHQKVVVSDQFSSIFDGAHELGIPGNDSYKNLSLSRVLELIAHEIRGHYVNQKNGEKFACGIRSAGDIEKEEGLAMAMEGLLRGYTLPEIMRQKRWLSEARILAGEVFAGNARDFSDVISLTKKNSTGESDTDESLLRRASRNLPFGYSQKKDLSYGAWLQNVIDYLEKSGDLKKLFSGKFGLEDIVSGNADFSKNSEMILPFFVEDIIIFYMTEEHNQLVHSHFVEFLRQKYAHVLKDDDFEAIEKLTHSSLKKVCAILNSIKNTQKNLE